MIRKRTATRLAAVAAVATVGLSLSTGMASADATFSANVPGCAGGMVDTFSNGHDWVRGYVASTMGDYCTVALRQSNGNGQGKGTYGPRVWTDPFLDAGITSYVVVCNGSTGRCATSQSY
ncbi:hypothetical protein [Kitasatospora sp. NPDC057936]|uniref:hypothetical protein n=1 Tax=Kitasatospora sp. NPDC057936 TaxID=3346283 RepID=UPI0036D7E624